MNGIHQVMEWDQAMTLWINGSNSEVMDWIMMYITSTWVWIPWAACLIYAMIRNNSWKGFLLGGISIALVVLLADQITSGFCKPYFHRFRPTQDPNIMYLVDIVDGYRGGRYGFMSSHAANTFGVAVFVALLIRNKYLSISVFLWALLNSYSRIYLGVHYLGDVLCGATIGILAGLVVYRCYRVLYRKLGESFDYNTISTAYTSGGYLISDIQFIVLFFVLTCFSILVMSLY